MNTTNAQLPPLQIVATYYDNYHSRQHYKGFSNKRSYCMVEIERGVFQLHSFVEEPECPIRADVDILEVDKQGSVIKQLQKASQSDEA
jgi:hypothetical protein